MYCVYIPTVFQRLFLSISANAADILNCYKCTSLTNPKCGATWGYKSASSVPAEAKTTCEGKNAACKKIVSNDGPEGKQRLHLPSLLSITSVNTSLTDDDYTIGILFSIMEFRFQFTFYNVW